ncbi:hypothetical protein ACQY0O_000151 [Thecaphora frezii]
MLYSTSPSTSSAASGSGRSSPDGGSQDNGVNSRSTPSFLPPFFISSNHPLSQQPQPHTLTRVPSFHTAAPPRRTSFGTALGSGGKLSALSALGFFPSSSTLGTSPTESSGSGMVKPEFGPRSLSSSTAEGVGKAANISQEATMQTSRPAPKRHMCFPDGMGGTMCVEIRDRDRRGSS